MPEGIGYGAYAKKVLANRRRRGEKRKLRDESRKGPMGRSGGDGSEPELETRQARRRRGGKSRRNAAVFWGGGDRKA